MKNEFTSVLLFTSITFTLTSATSPKILHKLYQSLQTNIMRIVQQTLRIITNEILEFKGLKSHEKEEAGKVIRTQST